MTTDENDRTEEKEEEGSSLRRSLPVTRRDMMRATGATGVLAGYASVADTASAQEGSTCTDAMDDVDPDCTLKRKYEEDSLQSDLACDCDPTADPSGCITYSGEGEDEEECVYITTSALEFYDATHVTLKVGNECQVESISATDEDGNPLHPVEEVDIGCKDEDGNTVLVEVREFCSTTLNNPGNDFLDISHVELFDCPQPAVVGLQADCFELVIDTDETLDGDVLTVEYKLQLKDVDGNVTDVTDVITKNPTVVGDDGVATIDDLADDTDFRWNQLEVLSVVHQDGTDMLADFAGDTVLTGFGLCEPPEVVELRADCFELFIDTDHAMPGDVLFVDYQLQLVDEDDPSTVLVDNVASFTDEQATVQSDGTATIDLSDDTTDEWNQVIVHSVEHALTGHEMLDPAPEILEFEQDGPNVVCNLPEVTDLLADCEDVTVKMNEFGAGDEVTIDVDTNSQSTGTTSFSDTFTAGDYVDADGDGNVDDLVVAYADTIEGYWTEVTVRVFHATLNRFLDLSHLGGEDTDSDGIAESLTLSTGDVCNPPVVADLVLNCDGLTITTERVIDGEMLEVCYTLQRLDDSCTLVEPNVVTQCVEVEVTDNETFVDLSAHSGWNRAKITDVNHLATGTDMLEAGGFGAEVIKIVVV